MPRPNRVTLEAISRELDLSTSSVSRALRNDPLIHPETRARVNTVAMSMGYQGRSRRAVSRPRAIGVLFATTSLSDIQRHIITMSYMQGMTAEAGPSNIALSMHTAMELSPKEANFQRSQADIWLVCGVHEPERIVRLAKTVPIISLVHNYPGVIHDIVSTNDFDGVSEIVAKLVKLGHRKCVYVSLLRDKAYIRARAGGFLEGARSLGLDLAQQVVIEDPFDDGKIGNPEPILKAIKKGATAIVTDSDHAAYEVAEFLAKKGIKVPRDVSLTGFNGINEPGQKSLNFTGYDPNFVEMGRAAVRLAKWRMENPSAAYLQITVRGNFVEGESIGPVPKGR